MHIRAVRALLTLAMLFASGCAIFVAGIDSVKQAGLTPGDREVLLSKQMKEFHNILFAGRVDMAMAYVEDDLQKSLASQLRSSFKTDKQTDHTIEQIDFVENSTEATVEVTMKFYSNTDYLIKERTITEVWVFHTGGSWRLAQYDASDPVTPGDRKAKHDIQ